MYLDLSNKNLTTIPVIPNVITELDLSHNQIKTIPKGCFPKGLLKLWLNNNNISNPKKEYFPKELQQLYMYDNEIKNLPQECFPEKLQTLHLSYNEDSNICDGYFPSQLKELWLKHIAVTMTNPVYTLQNPEFTHLSRGTSIFIAKVDGKLVQTPYGQIFMS